MTKNEMLANWRSLLDGVKDCDDEAFLRDLLKTEKHGQARPLFLRRIHQRLNKLRSQRERRELLG